MSWNRVLVSFEPDVATSFGVDLARLTRDVRDPSRSALDPLPDDTRPAACVMALAVAGRPTIDSAADLVAHAPALVEAAAARLAALVIARYGHLVRVGQDGMRRLFVERLLLHSAVCDLTPLRSLGWANDNVSGHALEAGDACERAEATFFVALRAAQAEGPLAHATVGSRLADAWARVEASRIASLGGGLADWVPGGDVLDELSRVGPVEPACRRVPLLLRRIARPPEPRRAVG